MKIEKKIARKGAGSAFSLVEILIILAIIGILASVIKASYSKLTRSAKRVKAMESAQRLVDLSKRLSVSRSWGNIAKSASVQPNDDELTALSKIVVYLQNNPASMNRRDFIKGADRNANKGMSLLLQNLSSGNNNVPNPLTLQETLKHMVVVVKYDPPNPLPSGSKASDYVDVDFVACKNCGAEARKAILAK